MPESKSGANLRQVVRWQKDAARAEYLRHPDASISQVAKAANCSVRTAARVRADLVNEGLLAPGRNAAGSGADAAAMALAARPDKLADDGATDNLSGAASAPAGQAPPADSPKKGTLDGDALRQMNEMLDELADEDDDATRKRMLRQMKRFAFDPNLHPDTRMSASQLWAKLLDMARAKDLGPGIPVTLEAAIARCTEFLQVCGAKVAVPAFYKAFDLGEVPSDGQGSQAVGEGQPPSATTAPAGPPNNDAQVRD